MKERYNDKKKLITNLSELQLVNQTEVVIYREDPYHEEIIVALEGQEDQFEELKPFIAFAAKNLCKMDYLAQRYDRDEQFADDYEVAYLYLYPPNIIKLTYYGAFVNTEFDVIFEYTNNMFTLKSFGTTKNIPSDWDK